MQVENRTFDNIRSLQLHTFAVIAVKLPKSTHFCGYSRKTFLKNQERIVQTQ